MRIVVSEMQRGTQNMERHIVLWRSHRCCDVAAGWPGDYSPRDSVETVMIGPSLPAESAAFKASSAS